jgi:D-alanine-D-alanine ligase
VLALCLHKGLTKTVVRAAGVPTPDFLVVERIDDLRRREFPLPVFAKPVAEGTGKGVDSASLARTERALEEVCKSLLNEFDQPVLVECYLPGRELTVGILGTADRARAIGTLEIVLGSDADEAGYTYGNKRDYERLVSYRLARDATARSAERIAVDAWRALGCRDGGRVDLRCDAAGNAMFLEVNPLAGLHPDHSDLPILGSLSGSSYQELIETIFESACLRLPSGPPSVAIGQSPAAGRTGVGLTVR